jgi:hypothetical protein
MHEDMEEKLWHDTIDHSIGIVSLTGKEGFLTFANAFGRDRSMSWVTLVVVWLPS